MVASHSRCFAELNVLKAIHPDILLKILLQHAGYLSSRQIIVSAFDVGCEVNL